MTILFKKNGNPHPLNCADAHEQAKINFDNLQGEKHYAGLEAYGQSKLANLLFPYELAHRLVGTGVTVNSVHPGFVATGFARNNGPVYNVGTWIAGHLFRHKPERRQVLESRLLKKNMRASIGIRRKKA